MEECVNKEHNDNNYIETYTSINTTYEGKETCLDDEEGEESTDTDNSNGEKFIERISIEKGIIPNTNVEEVKEGGVDNKRHDNIGGGDDDSE